MVDDLQLLLDRIAAGAPTEADLATLRRALSVGGEPDVIQVGKYNVRIDEGREVQIGDRHFHGPGADAILAALRELVGELRQERAAGPPPQPGVLSPDDAVALVAAQLGRPLDDGGAWSTPTGSRARRPVVLLLAGIGLLVVLVLALVVRWPDLLSPRPTPLPTAMILPTPTVGLPAFFPPLLEVAPPLTTTVILLRSPMCVSEQTELAEFLANTTAKDEPPVLLVAIDAPDHPVGDREIVRRVGVQKGADLLIWCTAAETGTVIHLEAITQRAVPEVYEPPTISMPAQPSDPMQRAVLGVVTYLRRDILGAASVLRTAADVSREEDVRAALTLLIGNIQTFHREYPAAADTFDRVVKLKPAWAFAWHNLGVAELYAASDRAALETALSAFEEARRLDPSFDLSLISMARIYRLTCDEVPDRYGEALTACERAGQSTDSAIRAYGATCAAITQVYGLNLGLSDKLPRLSDRALLEGAVTSYWAEPLVVLGFVERVYAQANHDPVARDRAQGYFLRYLAAARDDVHLEEARQQYQDAIDYALYPDE